MQNEKQTPDWTEAEIDIINNGILQRWKDYKEPLKFADVEIRKHPHDKKLTSFPAAIWNKDKCSFVIIKIDDSTYKNMFFYSGSKQFGTGIEQYGDLHTCTITLLQIQADYINS